jgi:uncharacterized protein with HEPN domain
MSPLVHEYLHHILDETHYLLAHTQGLDEQAFLSDETLKRAFVRSLEIVGEATKQLPEDFRVRYAQIEWRAIAGMRDRLIHGYFGVDYELVWDVIHTKIPELEREILAILAQEAG